MTEQELRQRTKQSALRIMELVAALPKILAGRVIGRQLVRCGTSVGANYRAACLGRSKADFIARLGIVEEEADESAYWMELIVAGGLMKEPRIAPLLEEARQIQRMMAASRRTARTNAGSRIPDRKSQIENRKSP